MQDKDELIRRAQSIQDLKRDYNELYALLDELGITYKRTTCSKCRQDYLNIIKEELGMIESSAEVSGFNTTSDGRYIYIRDRNYIWTKPDGTRVRISKTTPVEEIEEFVKTHKGFYKKIENKENE